jgi:pimeloyl-ACP methyl ester carboxylesterase
MSSHHRETPRTLYAKNHNISLYSEAFGNPDSPPVLLITGAHNQCIHWPEDFCTEIAEAGFYVIRYDHRDTGMSSSVDYEKEPYSFKALCEDAISVIVAHGKRSAHIIGMAMGGAIGQLLAIHYPEIVLSLTSLMSSLDQRVYIDACRGNDLSKYTLPPPNLELIEFVKRMQTFVPKDEEETIQASIEGWRIANGGALPFDEKEMYTHQKMVRSRAINKMPSSNHFHAVMASGSRVDLLHKIQTPTLVIHGENDPALPPEHARKTAEMIKGAQLYIVSKMGHFLAKQVRSDIAKQIVIHIKG